MKYESTNNACPTEAQEALVDALFSASTLFGLCLLKYEKHNRIEVGVVTEDDATDAVEFSPSDMDEFLQDPASFSLKYKEPSRDKLILQIVTFLRQDVKDIIGSSALYPMFSEALRLFGREGATIEEQINGMDGALASIAWILSRRAFAIKRNDKGECEIINTIGALLDCDTISYSKCAPVTEEDLIRVRSFCKVYIDGDHTVDGASTDSPIEANEELPPISTLPQTDKIYLPTSKVFNAQRSLVSRGATNIKINVGNEAVVRLSITNPEGGKLDSLSAFEVQLEATIGQIFQQFKSVPENRSKPLTVSAAQVYRVYAGKDNSFHVSEDLIEKTAQAVIKLIHTPATLDITEQLEKHTQLRRKKGYEGMKKERGKIGNLITGSVSRSSYNGGHVEYAFTIHELPMLYMYSCFIGQVASIDKKYLTGAKQRAGTDDISLQRYLLGQIERIKSDFTKKTEASRKASRYRATPKKPEKTHKENLLFSTISEGSGFNISTPKLSRTLREKVFAFMEEQKRLGNIKDCEYYLIKQRYAGITITIE